jgi:two-component system sensor histidine kinase FlrB
MVRDTGTGIPSDKLKKIFLPFYTLKDTGVGMGLALVHKIVTSHGGRVEVKSREGQGTEFVVTLPKG